MVCAPKIAKEAPVVYCGFPGCIPGQVCNLSQYREVLSPRPGPGSSAVVVSDPFTERSILSNVRKKGEN